MRFSIILIFALVSGLVHCGDGPLEDSEPETSGDGVESSDTSSELSRGFAA